MLSGNPMLPGPSARTLMLSGYISAIPGAIVLAATGVELIAAGMSFSFREHPFIGYGLFAIFILSVAAATTLVQSGLVKLRKEMAKGYVTMPYDYRSYDLRDSKTGKILRPRGEPGGRRLLSVSLRRWRQSDR